MDGPGPPLPRPRRSASSSPATRRPDAQARAVRLRHHLRHQQRVRLRLPPRQHGHVAASDQVQRGHAFAIVDEVDSILIDEARTPLIISGRVADAAQALLPVRQHRPGPPARRATTRSTRRSAPSSPPRRASTQVEQALGVENLYDDVNQNFVHQLQAALRAKELFKRDMDYIVADGEVKIVDEFTGRILEGRRWCEGLHQAVEAKEGVQIKEENQTLATITLQNYFRLYDKLAGMTGTAATEAGEFAHTYNLAGRADPHQPADGPRRPGRPHLQDRGRQVRRRRRRHRRALRDGPAGARRHDLGREVREALAAAREAGHRRTRCSTPSSTTREAEIVAQAGRLTAVTVATNMAGRGVDILLGGNPEGLAQRDAAGRGPRPRDRRGPGRATTSCSPRYEAESQGRGRQGARARRPLRARHRAPRVAAASTTSSAAAPAARATRARAASTCRSRTTSCACSPPAP